MQYETKPPFPKRESCRNCASKPCQWFLKTYNQPGSFMIVSPLDFVSIPCFTPSWAEDDKKTSTEPEALTDTMETTDGNIEVTNPRWDQDDQDKQDKKDASIGETIILMADVKNRPDGSEITFDIFDISDNSPFRIKTVKGKIENEIGKCKWTVEDPNKRGEKLKLSFEAIVRSKTSERCEIHVCIEKGTIYLNIKIDPSLDEYKSYSFSLVSTDKEKSYSQVKTIEDDQIDENSELDLEFTDVPTNVAYSFEVDKGDGSSNYTLFENIPYEELC